MSQVSSPRFTRALVLGAGGQVGISYHLGVLSAIEAVTGANINDVPLIVGTSAGSVIGAYIRHLGSAADAWDHFERGLASAADSTVADDLNLGGSAPYSDQTGDDTSAIASRVDQLRRVASAGVGMAGVFAKTWTRMPIPDAIESFLGEFPNAMLDFTEIAKGFYRELPQAWPDRALWITAFDLGQRRRVVFGSQADDLRPDLREALVASCAVPGVWEPRVVDGVAYVDGGVRGPANANVLIAERYGEELNVERAIIVAPMAFDSWKPREVRHAGWPDAAYGLAFRGIRAAANMSLDRDVRALKSNNIAMALFRPEAGSLPLHGRANIDERLVASVADDAFDRTVKALANQALRESVELCLGQ